MKRYVGFLMALILIVSFSACSGSGGSSSKSEGNASTTSKAQDTSSKEDTTSSAAEEGTTSDGFDMDSITYDENGYGLRGFTLPIADGLKLTMFAKTDVKWSATRNAQSELSSYQIIMEKTGIDVEFNHPAAGQTDEQLNLLMASNSLPDMVFYSWRSITGGPASILMKIRLSH